MRSAPRLQQRESKGMLKQIEGSRATAEGIALCRPEVICAYPITPQTHIVEGLGEMVRMGHLENCEFINVESEFAALSVAIGASAAGARAYTATSSQGLLFMTEAVYNASGLGLPIVMTLGNRAIGAPINIWNDHSDAMSMRDAGWMQLFAETNQEAVDLHIQAFRLAEELSMPVMVCVDGFILTHAVERVDIPDQADVDAFLPPYDPVQVLDPQNPISIGAMVGPDAFTEVRFLQHYKQNLALRLLPEFAAEFKARFGRDSGGLLRTYRADDAELLVIAMGSVNGTIKDTIDEARAEGLRIGLVTLVSFRPFPTQMLRELLVGTKHVVVIEKSFAIGMGGQLANNVDLALRNTPHAPQVHSVIAGLGGRPITRQSLHKVLRRALMQPWEGAHFLDLNEQIVAKELHHVRKVRRSGPTAENILRRLSESAQRQAAE
jgi:pyruvate ferredoxin oxidoreductase alpha subunit